MTKVVRMHQLGGPEVLRVDDIEVGPPGPGEVRIRVKAIGLNRVEAMFRIGEMGVPGLPSKLGYEAAGVIDAVGAGVTGYRAGQRVATLPGVSMEKYGTYGEVILYPADMLLPVPDDWSWDDAAASWMQYLTAYGLIGVAHLQPDDAVVITAASSSVGIAAIQITNMLGATPIAVTRNSAKAEALKGHGARHVVASAEQDVAEAVLAITDGQGARIVFDPVAGDTLPTLVKLTKHRGIIIIYGALAGAVSALPLHLTMMKGLTVRGFAMNDMMLDDGLRQEAIAFVLRGHDSGQLRPVIDRAFGLDGIVEAHRYLESNAQMGKIIVRLSEP
jgi:NADPH:quinone reductase-like Zn-dependent oxidoreductase